MSIPIIIYAYKTLQDRYCIFEVTLNLKYHYNTYPSIPPSLSHRAISPKMPTTLTNPSNPPKSPNFIDTYTPTRLFRWRCCALQCRHTNTHILPISVTKVLMARVRPLPGYYYKKCEGEGCKHYACRECLFLEVQSGKDRRASEAASEKQKAPKKEEEYEDSLD